VNGFLIMEGKDKQQGRVLQERGNLIYIYSRKKDKEKEKVPNYQYKIIKTMPLVLVKLKY